jgi:hypothetical protein
MRPQGAGNHRQAAHQQNQHDQRIEQARWLKVDVEVGDYAGQDEERTARGEQPRR